MGMLQWNTYILITMSKQDMKTFFPKSLTLTWIERRNPYSRRALCWLPQWMFMEAEARKAWLTVSNMKKRRRRRSCIIWRRETVASLWRFLMLATGDVRKSLTSISPLFECISQNNMSWNRILSGEQEKELSSGLWKGRL